MISIDRLRVRLPVEYRYRAPQIMRRVGSLLQTVDFPGNRQIEHLQVTRKRQTQGTTDEQLAQQISRAIQEASEKEA